MHLERAYCVLSILWLYSAQCERFVSVLSSLAISRPVSPSSSSGKNVIMVHQTKVIHRFR